MPSHSMARLGLRRALEGPHATDAGSGTLTYTFTGQVTESSKRG